uniref:Uncharacterized protein n=1 Tax=Panagrellus redivivus TaxID=6233 RepID=A0A7E4V4Y4_PANRE
MIKKRLARRATSNEAPSELSAKRMAVKKAGVAEPQIVINPGPRGKKPPLTSASSSTTVTSKPAELNPLAIPNTGTKPIDIPVLLLPRLLVPKLTLFWRKRESLAPLSCR